MKKIILVVLLTVAFMLVVFSITTASTNIPDWNVTGSINVVYDCAGATSSCWYISGSGSVSQSVPITTSDYALSVNCFGNPVITLEYNGVLQSQSCSNSTLPSTVFLYIFNATGGNAIVGANLSAGDRVDTFCMYPIGDTGCNSQATSLVQNFGFDNGQVAPTWTPLPQPTATNIPTPAPTPTCVPKGKSGKCK